MKMEKQMNKTLKWILISLGILVGLAIIASVVFHVFAFGGGRTGMMFNYDRLPNGLDREGNFGGLNRNLGRMPMMGFMPMMAFGLLRGILGLGVFALAVIGVVLLVRNGKAKRDAQSVAAPLVPSATPAVEKSCKHCGKTINEDWIVCPYCGKKQ